MVGLRGSQKGGTDSKNEYICRKNTMNRQCVGERPTLKCFKAIRGIIIMVLWKEDKWLSLKWKNNMLV